MSHTVTERELRNPRRVSVAIDPRLAVAFPARACRLSVAVTSPSSMKCPCVADVRSSSSTKSLMRGSISAIAFQAIKSPDYTAANYHTGTGLEPKLSSQACSSHIKEPPSGQQNGCCIGRSHRGENSDEIQTDTPTRWHRCTGACRRNSVLRRRRTVRKANPAKARTPRATQQMNPKAGRAANSSQGTPTEERDSMSNKGQRAEDNGPATKAKRALPASTGLRKKSRTGRLSRPRRRARLPEATSCRPVRHTPGAQPERDRKRAG